MFKSKSTKKPSERLLEEQIYAQVVDELSQGLRRDGLWAKALADSDGEESKAKALYIRYRVQSIVDEMVLANEEQIKIKQAEAARKLDMEREQQKQRDAQISRELNNGFKNILLFYGVLFLPYIFAWVTLRKGYGMTIRILSFSWLVLYFSALVLYM